MRSLKLSLVVLSVALMICADSAYAQNETFSDPNVDYTFVVPDAKWKMTAKPSTTSPNVEYVYVDRLDGHLEVRKVIVTKDSTLTDAIRDEEQRVRFRQGFVAGKEETFTGKLRGSIFNYEYVSGGKNMAGRFYFLRPSDTVIYVLRFTGQRDSMRSIRHHTDSIARTFSVTQ